MHVKFKELMVQAITECMPDDIPTKEKTLQRYGELVVKKCLSIMDQQWSDGHEVGQAMDDIEEHFGISYDPQ